MAATFPGGVKVFTTKRAGDQIASAHINDLQAEVVAVETELRKTSGSVVDHGSLAGLGDNDHPQYPLYSAWASWTPTITWSGGTTDPTSFTVLSARYVTVGKLVFCTLRGSLTRGSGDRSYLSLTAPVTISNLASGSAHHNINGNDFISAPLYPQSGKVSIFTGTMTKDGYIWASWFYEK
jgi:hypothetical protein